ncbi:MAG: hypothetical protein HYY44_00920 [Deltaproteobacteria bacterium]|nr:hypothetical protein [Deltaproteobacteria bacterium]MBI4374753.1 hypothetical protein [Deltaproteobacteria bacterium]
MPPHPLSSIDNLSRASCLHREEAGRILQDPQRTDREKKAGLASLQDRFVSDYRKAYPKMDVSAFEGGIRWGQRPVFEEGFTDPIRWRAHEQVWSAMDAVSRGNQQINVNFHWSVFSLVQVPWLMFFCFGDDIKIDSVRRANAATKRMLVGGSRPESGLQFGLMVLRVSIALVLPGLVAGSLYYLRHKDDRNVYPAVSLEGCGPKAG